MPFIKFNRRSTHFCNQFAKGLLVRLMEVGSIKCICFF